jgi:MYXO-CTERM domain-containing protein
VNNGCANARCPAGQFCRPDAQGRAQCVATCATVQCGAEQSCRDGRCVADPCVGVNCTDGQVCAVVDGRARCGADRCSNIGVLPGRVCVNGAIVDDPCVGVTCPGAPAIQCRAGQCIDPQIVPLVRDRVVGTGGDCAARPGSATGRAGAWAAALALAAFALRRRRADRAGEVAR